MSSLSDLTGSARPERSDTLERRRDGEIAVSANAAAAGDAREVSDHGPGARPPLRRAAAAPRRSLFRC